MPVTADKPVIDIPVVSVSQITVSTDPTEGAMITLATEDDADRRLLLSPTVLAQLEAMLTRAAHEQGKPNTCTMLALICALVAVGVWGWWAGAWQ